MKKLQNKKKLIYIILAVILIILGSYGKQFEEEENSFQVGSESLVSKENLADGQVSESEESLPDDYVEY